MKNYMKKIIFVTATRVDYGKLKTIMVSAQRLKNFKSYVFVTGVHNMKEYGSTHEHINMLLRIVTNENI